MLLSRLAGQTSQSVYIFIQDSSSTTGAGLTGLVFNTSGLTAYYVRTLGSSTQITLATLSLATSAYSSGGFKEIDATNMPGVYRLDLPNAAIAAGADSVTVYLRGATNMAPCVFNLDLTAWNNQDGVHGGLSCLPNTACTTNASLLTSGTGTDQLSVSSGRVDIGKALGTAVTLDANNVLNVSAKYLGGTLLTARDIGASVLLSAGTGTGQLDFTSGVVKANATQWLGGTIPAVNVTGVPLVDLKYTLGTISPAAAGYVGIDWGQVTNKTTANALTGTTIATSQVVASVSGAVGSVTGAVGSVTAAVTLSAGDSPVVATGTATAGSTNTITLQTALGADSLVNGCLIKITSGTGADQARVITGYVDATKVVTVDRNWTTNPTSSSVYAILYADAPKVDSSLAVTAGTVSDKTGYSLTQAFPANFSALAITAGGAVTVGTNNDKAGYALTSGEHTNIAGDVLNATASSYNTAGTIGNKINSAASAGDPWATAIPGAYGAGTAGNILGNNLNATVSSRMAAGNVTVGGYAAGQDPATLVLATPANKLATDTSGNVVLQAGGLNNVLIDGKTLPASLQIIGAVLAGNTSGAGTGTEVFKGLDGATTRATDTVDASGNRSWVYG